MYGELPELTTADGKQINALPVRILNPEKLAVLRLPTPDELLAYLSAQRSLYRDLGRRKGRSEDVPTPKADQTLFTAIRLDRTSGEDFDDAEALYAISLITRHRIDSCERVGQTYIITLSTLFGPTTHTLSIPTEKDAMDYRRAVYVATDLPHGVEERRFPPEVPCRLYDKVVVSSTGYAPDTPVPPHHKRAVVAELMSTLAGLDPSMDPN